MSHSVVVCVWVSVEFEAGRGICRKLVMKRGNRETAKNETYAETSLATIGAVVVGERTDNLIVGVRDRERAGKRGTRRHGDDHVSVLS